MLDQSIEYGVRMSKLIDEVTKDMPEEEETTVLRAKIKRMERSAGKTGRMGHDEIIWRNPAGRAQRGFSRIFSAFGSYTLKEAELLGILDEMLEGKKTIVILGHVNPDGDCIGSCLGLYNYLKENYEGLEVSVYLEKWE